MGPLDRGLYIVESEISVLLTSMTRSNLWNSSSLQDSNTENLIKEFLALKKSLGSVKTFNDLDTVEFLMPFLDVIRSEDVTGHVTGLALTAVHKFLAYDMIDVDKPSVCSAVENLADAVTHARFVGSDSSSDEVVLMKILEVLRILILSKVGLLLTNESICEIMQSTFRICFEPRLSELLRKTAQNCLTDMTQLLFTRLPSFTETQRPLLRKLKMRSTAADKAKRKAKTRTKMSVSPSARKQEQETTANSATLAASNSDATKSPKSPTTPVPVSVGGEMLARSPIGSVADLSIVSDSETTSVDTEMTDAANNQQNPPDANGNTNEHEKKTEDQSEASSGDQDVTGTNEKRPNDLNIQVTSPEGTVRPHQGTPMILSDKENDEVEGEETKSSGEEQQAASGVLKASESKLDLASSPELEDKQFTNEAGVTFQSSSDMVDANGSFIPYGLPAVSEFLRFLAALINQYDQENSERHVQVGLSLITCALEVGVESMKNYPSLMMLIKDDLSRNLISLLSTERLGMFSAALRCCFLIFSSLRGSLKLQLEQYLSKLVTLIGSESNRISYQHKELALEQIVLLYKLPGFVTEVYLNFDCGLYTTNLFEDLTKVLSKNAFPVAGLTSTNHLALDALLVILETIERQCQQRISDRVPQPPQFKQVNGQEKTRSESLNKISADLSLMNKSSGHQFGVNSNNKEPLSRSNSSAALGKENLVPTHESLMAIKHKKKLLTNGTELFNQKPSRGIEYLQENRLLSKPIDPSEVAKFLRENPHLCKNMIGEYISNKKNLNVLKSFVRSFDFRGLRIDEALRQFLQSFRLPGEAPLISMIMEIFGEHWHCSNDECLADADAPYTLAYAVIMLNTDQHNPNASKQNIPMTNEQFIKNLRGTNGGGEHDPEMLSEIYKAIREDEIIMPAEQTGLVKENYMWKVLLKRGEDEEEFIETDNGIFDHNLFSITWGPSVAALSYIFDKSSDAEILRRSLDGFSKCAMVAAHYAMSDVLDNLVTTLTKFTTLLSTNETPENLKIMYGANHKALLATRAVFSLTHKYGDILREGWRNLVQCLLQMFRCQLLPKSLMEAEDYIESSGRVSLYREDIPREKADTGLINSLVSFIVMSSEAPRSLSTEEEDAVETARQTVAECSPEHLLAESKFLLTESLQELMKFLVQGSNLESVGSNQSDSQDTMFFLELITRITIANRDRVLIIWRSVSDHISRLISATASSLDTLFHLERTVTALMRLTVRLARKEEVASTVVQSLRILLAMKPGAIYHVSKQISYGIHELLRNNAANIHSKQDWSVIFSLLEVVGAGASPEYTAPGLPTDEDSGQGGESDAGSARQDPTVSGGWIDLGKDEKQDVKDGEPKYNIVLTRQIVMHDSISFLKSCDTLSFLIRDVIHITPENFQACVGAIRTFVEASFKEDSLLRSQDQTSRSRATLNTQRSTAARSAVKRSSRSGRTGSSGAPLRRVQSEPRNAEYDADSEEEEEDILAEYGQVTMQLLDLMYTLHSQAAGVHQAWAAEAVGGAGGDTEEAAGTQSIVSGCDSNLWDSAWCPILQGMARLCADRRQEIRTQALTLLQRALLIQDLQSLQSNQWEYCFIRVLFPMLRKLLESKPVTVQGRALNGLEETKLRAAMMLNKVFLQHLIPLSSLPTFTALWLTILDFMQQFISTASTDLLADALPESLKNMLLVMDTSGKELFFFEETGKPTQLWAVTWQKIDAFLPSLRKETFGDIECKPVVNKDVVIPPVEQTKPVVEPEKPAEVNENIAVENKVEEDKKDANTSVLIDDVFISPSENPSKPNETEQPTNEIKSNVEIDNEEDEPTATATVIENNPIETGTETALSSPGIPPVTPLDPPIMGSSAFSLPNSPSHAAANTSKYTSTNALFAPIDAAPLGASLGPSKPIAIPTPVVAASNSPVITPPYNSSALPAPVPLSAGSQNPVWSSRSSLLAGATLPQFQTTLLATPGAATAVTVQPTSAVAAVVTNLQTDNNQPEQQ